MAHLCPLVIYEPHIERTWFGHGTLERAAEHTADTLPLPLAARVGLHDYIRRQVYDRAGIHVAFGCYYLSLLLILVALTRHR